MPTKVVLARMRLAFVAPAALSVGLIRATMKPRLIRAMLVRTHARNVRSLSRCSEARWASGIGRCVACLDMNKFCLNASTIWTFADRNSNDRQPVLFQRDVERWEPFLIDLSPARQIIFQSD